jgi:hypothetical protein
MLYNKCNHHLIKNESCRLHDEERKVKRGILVASLDAPIFSCVFVYAWYCAKHHWEPWWHEGCAKWKISCSHWEIHLVQLDIIKVCWWNILTSECAHWEIQWSCATWSFWCRLISDLNRESASLTKRLHSMRAGHRRWGFETTTSKIVTARRCGHYSSWYVN